MGFGPDCLPDAFAAGNKYLSYERMGQVPILYWINNNSLTFPEDEAVDFVVENRLFAGLVGDSFTPLSVAGGMLRLASFVFLMLGSKHEAVNGFIVFTAPGTENPGLLVALRAQRPWRLKGRLPFFCHLVNCFGVKMFEYTSKGNQMPLDML